MIPAWVKGTVLLGLTLTAGIVIGVAYERRHPSVHELDATHHVMNRLKDELALDSAQQVAIAAIFARRQAAVDSTWHVLQPHVRAAMDSTLREIVQVLRPDQAATYRKMVETRHSGALP
jgi:1,2-phenylacetyl-CoA epoxidase PaaB subunit